jgi:anaerobic ribonucleoside-triphosphate reductase
MVKMGWLINGTVPQKSVIYLATFSSDKLSKTCRNCWWQNASDFSRRTGRSVLEFHY